MALIRKLEKSDLENPKIHGEVDCTYTTFLGVDGKRYFQIDTYGSRSRQLKGKKIQTIQFDEITDKQLLSLFKDEFSLS